ncbi:MAG: TraG/TraD/VirD4 family protein [Gemmataceae bacterium]
MSLVHMVIDEAAALGPLEAINDMLALGRGYGLRVHLFYQNAAQLMRCYPDGQHQVVLGTTTNIYFGAHDWVTCEEISKRSGSRTAVVDSGGTGVGGSRQTSDGAGAGSTGWSHNSSENWSFVGEPLIRPEQVAALPNRVAITFAPGVPAPLLTWLTRYYEEPPPPKNGAWLPIAAGSLLRAAAFAALGVAAAVLAATARLAPPARTGLDPVWRQAAPRQTPTTPSQKGR